MKLKDQAKLVELIEQKRKNESQQLQQKKKLKVSSVEEVKKSFFPFEIV